MERQKVKKVNNKKRKVNTFRRIGIFLIFLGLAFQPLNILTYGLFNIDIDLFGLIIFIVGLILTIINCDK